MRERFLVVALAFLVQFAAFGIFSDRAHAEFINLTDNYTYKVIPSIGLQLLSTEVSGSAQIVPGPSLGLKYLIEDRGFFCFPSVDVSFLLGLDTSPATLFAVGLNAGGWIDPKVIGVWLGLGFENIMSYKTQGSAALKGGIFLPSGDQNLWMVEANWSSLNVNNLTTGTTSSYSLLGVIASYSFVFPVFTSKEEDEPEHHPAPSAL